MGIFKFGEFPQHVGHFITSLATAHIYYDFGVGPFGQLVLDNGLAAAEGTGHRRRSALGHREKGIDNPLAGYHGYVGRQFLCIGSALPNRPFLEHLYIFFAPVGFQGSDIVGYGSLSFMYPAYPAFNTRGHHYPMLHQAGLLDLAQDIPRSDIIPHLDRRLELPFLITVQGCYLYTLGDPGSHPFPYGLQWPLDTIEYGLY